MSAHSVILAIPPTKGQLMKYENDEFFDEITPVSGTDERKVIEPINLEELGRTLAGCSDSAPGPDGIPYSYYKALWRTMGPLLVEAWSYTIRTGNLCESHKISFLKLIPKPNKDLKNLQTGDQLPCPTAIISLSLKPMLKE